MLKFLRNNATAILYSLGLHVVLAGALTVGFAAVPAVVPTPVPVAIKATVIDEQRIREEMERIEAAQERERQAELERQRQIEEQAAEAKRAQEREQQRLVELRKQREADERAAREREAAKKKAEEEARRAAERRKKERLDRDRKAELERKQAEAREKTRLAALDKKRRAEQAARAEAETDLQRQLEAEERRMFAETSGLLAQYITLIRQKVERNWNRPASAGFGLSCEVNVTQLPGGEVVDVRFGRCNGDAATVRSIEAAVYKSSPLPEPADATLFERQLVFEFKPDEDL